MPARLCISRTILVVMIVVGSVAGSLDLNAQSSEVELNDANVNAWRDHILPNSTELGWQDIPWLTTFKDGILAAEDADKPLLFWTMNGHPLGCT